MIGAYGKGLTSLEKGFSGRVRGKLIHQGLTIRAQSGLLIFTLDIIYMWEILSRSHAGYNPRNSAQSEPVEQYHERRVVRLAK
jgi:ABC-type uncharacterized transport system permease subunit